MYVCICMYVCVYIYIYIYIYILADFENCRYCSPGKRKPTSSLYVNQNLFSRRLLTALKTEASISFKRRELITNQHGVISHRVLLLFLRKCV